LIAWQPAQATEGTYRIIEVSGKKGIVDQSGAYLVPPIYQDLGWTDGSNLPVDDIIGYRNQQFWGLLNIQRGRITPAKYAILSPVKNGENFIAARKGRLSNHLFFGVLDRKGRAIVGFEHESVQAISEFYLVGKTLNGQLSFGLMNQAEKFLLPPEYEKIKVINADILVAKRGDFWRVFNDQIKQIGTIKADSIEWVSGDILTYYTNGRAGLVDLYGRILTEATYKSIVQKETAFKAQSFPKWTAINICFEEKFNLDFDHIVPVSKDLKLIDINHARGLIDEDGHFLLPPSFEAIERLDNGLFLVRKNNKYGVVNVIGNPVIPIICDTIFYNHGFFMARVNEPKQSGWTVYLENGERISDNYYEGIKELSPSIIGVKINGLWTALKKSGKQLSTPKFKEIEPFQNGFAIAKYLDRYGIIDSDMQFIIQPQYEEINYLGNDLYALRNGMLNRLTDISGLVHHTSLGQYKRMKWGIVEIDDEGKYGLIGLNKETLLPTEWDSLQIINEHLVRVHSESKGNGIWDVLGVWHIHPNLKYEDIFPPSEGFYRIIMNGKYGFVDDQERLRIANRYDGAYDFRDGAAAVKLNGKWGFIDQKEKLIVQPLYDSVGSFNGNHAIVFKLGKAGIINQKGQEVVPIEYDNVIQIPSGDYMLYNKDQIGYLSSNLDHHVRTKFDWLSMLPNGFIIAFRRNQYGILDRDGLTVVPFIYDDFAYDRYNGFFYLKEQPEEISLKISTD
jgi:hypothetical protein